MEVINSVLCRNLSSGLISIYFPWRQNTEQIDPKKPGKGRVTLNSGCHFSRNVFSRKRVTYFFFVAFNIIISHIFETFLAIHVVVQKTWRFSHSILTILTGKLRTAQFSSRIIWNIGLVASDLFPMCTQSINFCTFYVTYWRLQMFEKCDSSNKQKWMVT